MKDKFIVGDLVWYKDSDRKLVYFNGQPPNLKIKQYSAGLILSPKFYYLYSNKYKYKVYFFIYGIADMLESRLSLSKNE